MGSTVEQQPVGKLVQQSFGEVQRVKLSKPTTIQTQSICDRSGKPEDTEHVLVDKGKTSRSHEIDEKRLHKELGSSDRSVKPESDNHKHHKSHYEIDVMKDIHGVSSNVQAARQEALLYVFEDNEAVIKMIIKRQKSYIETRFQNPQRCS